MMKPTLRMAAAAAAMLACGAQAQITNPSFEDGLNGWQTLGDATTLTGGVVGLNQLWLTTAAFADVDDDPLPAGALNRSGMAPAAVGSPGGVEEYAGLALGALDPDAANGVVAYEGSVARQSFQAASGTVLSFQWDFGSNDPGQDFAFAVVDGSLHVLARSVDAVQPGVWGNAGRTGYQSFSITLNGSGTHSVAFGVVDVADYGMTSTLAVDGLVLTAVPEPSAWALGLLALAGSQLLRKRRK